MYDIKNLNLSHNQIKEVAFRRLPHGVERLNFSHNQLADTLYWDAIFTPQLRTLSLANNALTLFVPIIANMDTVDLSNNQLRHIVDIVPWGGGHGPFLLDPTAWKYLDVRGNPNLSAQTPQRHCARRCGSEQGLDLRRRIRNGFGQTIRYHRKMCTQ